MNTLLQDVRYAVRMLRKSPGFTAVAILTLALGIGANTALFSVVNGVLLNPLPYPRANQLVSLYWTRNGGRNASASYPNFEDWRKENTTFAAMGGYRESDMALTGTAQAELVSGAMVSANFFSVLGVKPILGRMFQPEEDTLGAAPVVILSEGFWKRRFGAAPSTVGRTLELDGTAYSIIGVVPGKLPPLHNDGVYTPLAQFSDPEFRNRNVSLGTVGIARLRSGMTLAQARADMESVARNLASAYPDEDKDTHIYVAPLKEDLTGQVAPLLFMLLGAVGFVLLIACANVANLMLVRSTARVREFAIRAALGASAGRLIRQLLTEALCLSTVGGALGLLLAAASTRAALSAVPRALPRADDVHLSATVLLFALLISILTGVIFGLAPAVRAAPADLHETLKEGGRGASGLRHRAQNIFVVAEFALALVLLAGAGLMIRTLVALSDVNPGFSPQGVLTFQLSLSQAKLAAPAAVRQAYRELSARFRAIPGVESVSPLVGAIPLQGYDVIPFWRADRPKPALARQMDPAQWYAVGPDYWRTLRIPLERGRLLSAQDTENTPFVAVVDDGFARTFFPHEDPIGKRLNIGILNAQAEIVGVVGRVKQINLGASGGFLARLGQIYFLFAQLPDKFQPLLGREAVFAVRTASAPAGFVEPIRAASAKIDNQDVLSDFAPLTQVASDSVSAQRFAMRVLGVFALLALLLASMGIYGVLSYSVAQRTHQIGIRMALGAQPRDVLRWILANGAKLALLGIAIGTAAALALTTVMTAELFGVTAHDPFTFAVVAALLAIVALLACYIPARRAMKVDPMVALRYE